MNSTTRVDYKDIPYFLACLTKEFDELGLATCKTPDPNSKYFTDHT